MDPLYPDHGANKTYSHNPRSRDNSTASPPTTESLFQSLRLADTSPAGTPSFDTSSFPSSSSSRPPSSRGLASPAFQSPTLPHSTSFLHDQPPRHPSSYPSSYHQPPANLGNPAWFDTERHHQSQQPPLLRVEPAPEELQPPTSSPPLPSVETGAMSAVALPYDAGFSMGSRSSFTWPGVEQSHGLLGPDLNHYGSDASLTPPSGSRSVTASPPRHSLTAEQRELKRQRDQARHNSKMQARGRRTGSGSSSVYSPPSHLSELVTGASSMPVYTTAPPQISLLAEPPTSQYLPPFGSPIPDHHQSGMFQPQAHYPPPSYMAEYPYPPSSGPGLPSHYGRPMATDPNMGMYGQAPPAMGAGPHDATGQVRVVTPKPKPQCWEHGCNGRQFSTFSNLLRHQREKSGQATKSTCPNCGAEFTRTTARNGHLAHDKCKQKKAER
ncbi:hypothetical protein QBC39DRAFT_389741 [Podospora conica]|nr:hypothetical protein QBC39DRAFT_389741 [Schizothecium conicum]